MKLEPDQRQTNVKVIGQCPREYMYFFCGFFNVQCVNVGFEFASVHAHHTFVIFRVISITIGMFQTVIEKVWWKHRWLCCTAYTCTVDLRGWIMSRPPAVVLSSNVMCIFNWVGHDRLVWIPRQVQHQYTCGHIGCTCQGMHGMACLFCTWGVINVKLSHPHWNESSFKWWKHLALWKRLAVIIFNQAM